MTRSTIVINVDIRETRVALIEGGVIAELQIERDSHRGTVGNIVLGKVTRVLPGMQAAFIDVGQERSAFLHVEDLIRPDDFDLYLAQAAGDHKETVRQTAGKARARGEDDDEEDDDEEDDDDVIVQAASVPAADEDDDDDDEVDSARPPVAQLEADDEPADSLDEPPSSSENGMSTAAAGEDEDDEDEDGEEAEDVELEAEGATLAEAEVVGGWSAATLAPSGQLPLVPLEAVSAGVSQAVTVGNPPTAAGAQNGVRGRSRRRRRGRREPALTKGGRTHQKARQSGKPSNSKKGRRSDGAAPARVTRSVPITEVVREGDAVVVQISKEPIGTKGARVTSHVSLPGRYVVYLPTVDHLGISKRIGSARERQRLREVIDSIKPPRGGLIVRTVAEGLTKKQLKADIGYLVRVWAEVCKRRESATVPQELYTELDLVLKVARDLFTDDVSRIVIDDRDQYNRLVRFVEMFLPERVKDIELYAGDEPIFDAYGIEDEIARALSRKVPLPSGGSLIVDQAEALTAIDVNTGRYVGKGSKDLEETALKTNLEAVEEIAYQLRFRNIGGLVILDLIDMERAGNRERVLKALEAALVKDKAKTTLNRISDLGLIEMTRKRTRESLGRMLHEPCFYCDGTGQIQSKATIGYEILRQIRRERHGLPGYSVVVNAHPAVVDFLKTEDRAALEEAERRYARRIELYPRTEYHIEQYDLHGK
jgi:ribonuclease G